MPKINRDGVDIYCEIHGSGPPLLLTHGYSSTSEMWHGQIEALSRHHKLVLWDMRGHGRSDYPDIKVPSLVVVGADDTPFLAASDSDYMAAKIPGAAKVVIPGRRPRRQHRPAAGLYRPGAAVPR